MARYSSYSSGGWGEYPPYVSVAERKTLAAKEIAKLTKKLGKLKNELTKGEVGAVNKRISSMGTKLPIPKGVDPYKARPDRKAARGR